MEKRLAKKQAKEIKHNCQAFCAICSPVRALEVLIAKASAKRAELNVLIKLNKKT